MAKKAHQSQSSDKNLEGIEHALTRTEQFIEDNSKILTYVILGAVAVVLIFIGFKRLYLTPLEEEASSQMFVAERLFNRDSFELALNGYGTYPGFLEITEDYGMTKTANLANYYAGVCYLQLDDYENAVDFLEDFKTGDLLVGSTKFSALGDAYAEIGEYSKAVNAYNKGIDKFPNDFSTPLVLQKMGIVYEEMGDYENAIDSYREILKEYPETPEGRAAERYIARAEMKLAK